MLRNIQHMKTVHEGIKDYQCREAFCYSQQRDKHIKNIHGEE